jgi:hypothetical protein
MCQHLEYSDTEKAKKKYASGCYTPRVNRHAVEVPSPRSQKYAGKYEYRKDSNKDPDPMALVGEIKNYMTIDFHSLIPPSGTTADCSLLSL